MNPAKESATTSGQSAFGKRAQVWHAFNALDEQKKGEVLKSQLKVLTHNLLTGLGLPETEDKIEAFMPLATTLLFRDFMSFFEPILVKAVGRFCNADDVPILLDKLDHVCWFICSRTYVNQPGRTLDGDNCFKIWCVFNVLAQTGDGEDPVSPAEIDREEAEILVEKVHRLIGIVYDKDGFQRHLGSENQFLGFPQLLKLVEKYLFGVDANVVNTVVAEIHEQYVLGVLKKGYLTKKGHFVTNWKERWCVLTPNFLRYFVSRDEKELKGEFRITSKCTVENVNDRGGSKQSKFILKGEGKDYEVSVPDPITKTEWVTAFNTAISYHTQLGKENPMKAEIRQRRLSRLARRERLTQEQQQKLKQKELIDSTQQQLDQEMTKRMDAERRMQEEEERRLRDQELMAKTKEELEAVSKARAEAEARWANETAQLEREKAHLRELEELHRQLSTQLEKERNAREQEELSRKRQEEIIMEEAQKKRELEAMQSALESLLMDEKQKRENLEEGKLQQEALLKQETIRLQKLEREREERDREYQVAREKLQQAEREKDEALRLLKRKKETPFGSALFRFVESEATDEVPVIPVSHRGEDFLLSECAIITQTKSGTAKN